ncbi:MAG: (d)CMP kinase [Oscillospiraceae bacterium]|nr:(d)CMP kinase [Oscillospiraceae bacterium]
MISIALDGPSGAGKSTLAKAISARFGFVYVDTGAIYRTLGLAAIRAGISSKDADGIIAMLPEVSIEIGYDENGTQSMFLGGENVSGFIRTPECSIYASDVSAIPAVRAYLLEMQRATARKNNVIMDGRDIGTVVLPDAGLKVFVTADVEERARRRCLELEQKGMPTPFDEVLRDMHYRDEQDSNRATAPLRQADDAILLDTTNLNFEQSVEALAALVRERFAI